MPSAENRDTREKVEVPIFHPGLSVASRTSGSAAGTTESVRDGRLKVSVAMER